MSRRDTHAQTHPTYTSQVLEALITADDALRCADVAEVLSLSTRCVSAALHNLYRHHAVDVIEGQDTLWWYATPDTDNRTRIVKAIVEGYTRNGNPRPGTKRRKANEKPKRD